MKTSSGNHGVSNIIEKQGWKLEDVYVRMLFTQEDGDETELESLIHGSIAQDTGNTFAWREASSGNAGMLTKLISSAQKLSILEKQELIRQIFKSIQTQKVKEEQENLDMLIQKFV
jgi:hypothetical protein